MCVYVCECMYEHFLIVPSQPYRPGFKSFRQSPPWSLWPPRPPRPPWASHKSPQCYSNNRPRDKEHIYTSGAFFESKKALFGRFPNSPLPPKKKKKPRAPFAPPHPTSQFHSFKKSSPFQWWRRGSQIYYTKPNPTRQSTSTPNLAKPPLYRTKAL